MEGKFRLFDHQRQCWFSKIALAEKSIEGNWIARDANSLDIDNTVSVSSPVVWEEDDGYHMLFRHEESGLFSIKSYECRWSRLDYF